MKNFYQTCQVCPRNCRADRAAGRTGYCGVPETVVAARASLHYWEEPCISGTKGSGTVFFSGCNLRCVYCQNYYIAECQTGKEITIQRLAEIFLELQDQGANNINLVTPSHYVPSIAAALGIAKENGLVIPIVYNCGGYESVESLRMLDGLVDIYLTDFKYMDPTLARAYSRAEDYPEVARAALVEMVRQCPELIYEADLAREKEDTVWQGEAPDGSSNGFGFESPDRFESSDENEAGSESPYEEGQKNLLRKGVIVRHLLLPGAVKNAKAVVSYVYETYRDAVALSIMSQYTPLPQVADIRPLNRSVTKREYQRLLDYCMELGITNCFIQEGEVNKESFIPDFDCRGI